MTKILMFIALFAGITCFHSYAQIKYGYAVLYLRCGREDPDRDRIYFSPVIELDRLNFKQYTEGMDPSFPKYSVRYYTYAIDKWFEIFLRERYGIIVNDIDKYERNATCEVFDEKPGNDCNDDKTSVECFFTDKQKLINKRTNVINENKTPQYKSTICEVINLR